MKNIKCYVRTKYINTYSYKLSDGRKYREGDTVWLEVSPLKWIVYEREKLLISKILVASGIRFCDDYQYNGDFENTEMYRYLNTYFAKDIIPSFLKEMTPVKKEQYEGKQKRIKQRKKVLICIIVNDVRPKR